jgi:hypothetical protein
MNLHGLCAYEKAIFLWQGWKKDKIATLSQEKLARAIAANIGCSKQLNTVGNYTKLMLEFGMIIRDGNGYKVGKELKT